MSNEIKVSPSIFPPELNAALVRMAACQDYSERWRDAYFAQALIYIGGALARMEQEEK